MLHSLLIVNTLELWAKGLPMDDSIQLTIDFYSKKWGTVISGEEARQLNARVTTVFTLPHKWDEQAKLRRIFQRQVEDLAKLRSYMPS